MIAFIEKLRAIVSNNHGESLVEVLVSIVVSGLAILMLATTVAAASHIVLDNRTAMEKYYDESNKIVQSGSGFTQTGTAKLVVDRSDEEVGLEEGDSELVVDDSDEEVGLEEGDSELVVDDSDEVVRLEESASDSVKVSYDVSPDVGGKVMATYEKVSS